MTTIRIETVTEILRPVRVETVDRYRAYIYITRLKSVGESPRAMRRDLKTVEALEARARARSAIRDVEAPLVARINCARWIGLCPCGAAVALHPDWPWAGCRGCGRIWTSIVFPDPAFLAQIDAVLAQRPARPDNVTPYRFYSWEPGETIEDLEIENLKIAAFMADGGR